MDVRPTEVMVWGIVAAALASSGLPGLICGIIGKNKTKAYMAANGVTCGKVKTGSILSNVGIIGGAIMTAFWVIYVTVLIITFMVGASGALMNMF